MSYVSPAIRTIFTDVTGPMSDFQMLGRCAKPEADMMGCLEAYGLDRGLRKCQDLIDEFYECQTLKKQFARFVAMRKERERQIACGILTGDKKYVSPRIDSY
ncbi:unnamed protein product [Pieris macdunnoughi]|uniref:NADH dehydrogenase [ubiquinone] iron-sulfur protein 5 n=1 Tax=Pieris macdunnoughi TaxID=345717 RepID=A0A821VWY2_9NEOP|nr:unnamed protein product [Pieris macdunnoughi]